ncbi:hypothetical protein [Gordonia malaquae]|uniref:hypothetical protein n=1 Tax=Gordonia malaquae TaxID=410332 RepID=UPI0030FE7E54
MQQPNATIGSILGNAPLINDDDPRVNAGWQYLAATLERIGPRAADPDGFPVQAGSSLARDDQLTTPYQVSHSVQQSIVAGIDHLDAIKHLVIGQGVLNLAATWTLARGAIENLAVAYWLLTGSRQERVERTLRVHAKNSYDQYVATKHMDEQSALTAKVGQHAHIKAIAERNGIDDSDRLNGFTATSVLEWTSDRTGGNALFAWRLCSGFAHGRSWAYLGALERRENASNREPGVVNATLTNSVASALTPILLATNLAVEVVDLFDKRAQPV